MENFTRNFVGKGPSSSIEEYGWGAAALFQLKRCTSSPADESLYNSFIGSITTSRAHYAAPVLTNQEPNFTYQYAEAASGLMLGGAPYNYSTVLALMNAVFQSNMSGVVYNQPITGADLANTETLPAYILSIWLFQNEMKNATGYSIMALNQANVASVDYSGGILLVEANRTNGSITISIGGKSVGISMNGSVAISITSNSTATSTLMTTLTTVTTTTVASTITQNKETLWSILVLVTGVVLSVLGLAALGIAFRRMRSK